MARTLRPWTPASFSEVASLQSRSLSTFIAIAAERSPYTQAAQQVLHRGVAGIVLIALGMGGSSLRIGLALPVMALGVLLAGFSFFQALQRGTRGEVFERPRDAQRISRRRTVARLNRERRAKGLDRVINPQILPMLEHGANLWERIGHALQSQTWSMHPELRLLVETTSLDLMEELVTLHCGSLTAEGISRSAVPDRSREIIRLTAELAALVEAGATEMEMYTRPTGVSAGAPLGDAFPAVAKLAAWLESQRLQEIG